MTEINYKKLYEDLLRDYASTSVIFNTQWEVLEETRKIASWASGKDFETVEAEYLKQKEEFPEFHS